MTKLVRMTAEEVDAAVARGDCKTDMNAVKAKTNAQLEQDIENDPDFRDVPRDWYKNAKKFP